MQKCDYLQLADDDARIIGETVLNPQKPSEPTTLPNLLASIILSRLAKLLSRWLQSQPCSYFIPPP